MRFLITGGAGFIGVALANTLVQAGHTVRVLDDLSTGDAERLDPAVHFTRGSVEDKPKVWRLLNKIDCVYHLAARVSVPESILYPREYNATNVSGTVAIMEALRDAGIKRVVLASSGAVYGEQRQAAVVHETLLPRPASPYAVSKLAAENYVRTIGEVWDIETVSLRIFNAYGPGQAIPPTHPPVIPQFLRQILHGGSLVIYGNGENVRDYIYVDDVVEALLAAATVQGINRQVINIGTGVGTSINALVSIIEQVTGREARTVSSASVSAGVSTLVADTRLASELLKFKPKISLTQGLALLLARDRNITREVPSL